MASEMPAQERADLRVVQSGDEDGAQGALALLEHAQRVSEDAIAAARAEADRVLMAAQHEAQQLRQQAREQADREVSEAARKAEVARAEAQEEADRVVADARNQVTEIEQARARLAAARESTADAARDLARRLVEAADSGNFPESGS